MQFVFYLDKYLRLHWAGRKMYEIRKHQDLVDQIFPCSCNLQLYHVIEWEDGYHLLLGADPIDAAAE